MSPDVMSMMPVARPRSFSLRSTPPAPISASSGCGPKARMSTGMVSPGVGAGRSREGDTGETGTIASVGSHANQLSCTESTRSPLILPRPLRMFYFAYGSNLDPEQMRERCPGHAVVGLAELRDHKLTFQLTSHDWGGGVASV